MTRTGRRAMIPTPGADEPRRTYACTDKDHQGTWAVVVRNGNYSAFSGYRFTPSDYSSVRCGTCHHVWRTKAAYVAGLPDAPRGEN
jgi:hypothetical protein